LIINIHLHANNFLNRTIHVKGKSK